MNNCKDADTINWLIKKIAPVQARHSALTPICKTSKTPISQYSKAPGGKRFQLYRNELDSMRDIYMVTY